MKHPDVLIVGGGVMGCASAWELARLGARVTVLERSVPGAEASSAAAGILGAQVESHGPGPMTELCLASRARYADFAGALVAATGIDVGYRACGVLRVGFSAREKAVLAREVGWQKKSALKLRELGKSALLELEPALSRKLAGGVLFEDDARVDPRPLLRALHIAAARAGAEFRSGAYVRRVKVERGRALGVELDDGSTLAARDVVVAAGSWTTLIEGIALPAGRVVPARGQIIELELALPPLERVVFGPGAYLVPRDDGRVHVGSTVEFVGYQRDVTAGAVRDLLSAATALVPALAGARFGAAWSNFRPYTKDERPLLGPSRIKHLVFATGHYRNGILLAPITAEIVARAVRGESPPISLDAFRPGRSL